MRLSDRKKIASMFTKFKNYLKINWIKTILFNFEMLPFRQAIHFPVVLYGKMDIKDCKSGRVELITPRVRFNMCSIGSHHFWSTHIYHPQWTQLIIYGTMRISEGCRIGNGCCVSIKSNAIFEMKACSILGANSKVYCTNHIEIGYNTRISWECQLFDSNFHFYAKEGIVNRIDAPIIIGNNCWIGNRVSIMRGAMLGTWSIVASNSIVNKDFSNIEKGMFAGSPAKCIANGVQRIFNLSMEKYCHNWFNTHPNEKQYLLTSFDENDFLDWIPES